MVVGDPNVSLVDVILEQRKLGKSNKEIIEELKAEGRSSEAILEGMKKAQLKSAAGGAAGLKLEPGLEPEGGTDYHEEEDTKATEPDMSTEEFETLAEKIIEDKWKTVEKELGEIKNWKGQVEGALVKIQEKVGVIGAAVEEIKTTISDKMADYSKNMDELLTDVQAMDMVFKRTLPEFTENVRTLSEAVSNLTGAPRARPAAPPVRRVVRRPAPVEEEIVEEAPAPRPTRPKKTVTKTKVAKGKKLA